MNRILIYSPAFFPNVGGLELMSLIVANGLAASGHEVTLVTRTPDPTNTKYAFKVVRTPSPIRLLQQFRHSDLVLQMNISLKGLWPFLFFRRPFVAVHQGIYRRLNGQVGVRDRLKYIVARYAHNICNSNAVAAKLATASVTIHNAYNDNIFRCMPDKERVRELVFVGRLVSVKGALLLLEAIVDLRDEGLKPTLTIIGYGPEEHALKAFCQQQKLFDQVSFAGQVVGTRLAAMLNEHKIMVVPSLWEDFGIVALEGVACGCVVIGSDAGGLPEAIGPCGITFRGGDRESLKQALRKVLLEPGILPRLSQRATVHLRDFTQETVCRKYLQIIQKAIAEAM